MEQLPTDHELADQTATTLDLNQLGYHYRPLVSHDDLDVLAKMCDRLQRVELTGNKAIIRVERGVISMGAPAWCLVAYIDTERVGGANGALVVVNYLLANAMLAQQLETEG